MLLLAAVVLAFAQNSAHDINEKLGRGVNLGNTFEVEKDGGYGESLNQKDLERIADWGFSHIRVPIRWSDYALTDSPYTVEQEFIDTIKRVVEIALENHH